MALATTPRFTAGHHFGEITVRMERDGQPDMAIVHQAKWDEDIAAFVVAQLAEQPRRVAHFTWEAL